MCQVAGTCPHITPLVMKIGLGTVLSETQNQLELPMTVTCATGYETNFIGSICTKGHLLGIRAFLLKDPKIFFLLPLITLVCFLR
jgi:hypothetical protein